MLVQRVVSYFCFLEHKIDEICRDLRLDPRDYQTSDIIDHTYYSGMTRGTCYYVAIMY